MAQMYRGKVVTETEVITDGIVVIEGDTIKLVGDCESVIPQVIALLPDDPLGVTIPAQDPNPKYILPGLVDIHNHGGGGASFPDATEAQTVRIGAAEHLRHGTTTMLASTVTASREVLLQRAELFGQLTAEGVIAGMHAEGPFLSIKAKGAQSPDYLIPGDAALVRDLAKAAQGALKTMTVAPEIPGVIGSGGAAEALVEVGAIPSLGHTASTQAEAEALIDQVTSQLAGTGKTMTVTHMFNGMPSLHHRSPGPLAACLPAAAQGRIVAELVCDGVHIDPNLIRSMQLLLGSSHIAYVTDAMAAAGMADGAYQLGPMAVVVGGGVARLANPDDPETPGSIAGGTSHLLDQVKVAVTAGVPLVDAVRSASATPARALGFTQVGSLAAGKRADLVITDEDFQPLQVIRAGRPI